MLEETRWYASYNHRCSPCVYQKRKKKKKSKEKQTDQIDLTFHAVIQTCLYISLIGWNTVNEKSC